MHFKQLRSTAICLLISVWLIISFQEVALARPRLDTCASRFNCTPEEIRSLSSSQEDLQGSTTKMPKNVEFTIVVTPPLIDTASGLPSVLDKLPYLQVGRLIILPETTEDKDRGERLGRNSDMGVFTFMINESSLSSSCQQIASEILSQTGIGDKKILIEGEKSSSVIPLKNIDAVELANRIFAIVSVI